MQSNNNFVRSVASTNIIEEGNTYVNIFQQYEKVVIDSLITSFGLDFIVKDQHGGDVDTIYNVRKIGQDELMSYKNSSNEKAYDERGDYSYANYHGGGDNKVFSTTKHEAREKWQEDFKDIDDQYYRDLILKALEEHGTLSRPEIDALLCATNHTRQ